MTTHGLSRRLDVLEESAYRQRARRYADEYGIDVDELIAGAKRVEGEQRRLQALGLPNREIRQRLVAWVAADVRIDAARLLVEWERD